MYPLIPLAHGVEDGFWRLFLQWPPLHPILVNVTAGLIPAAVGFDLLGRLTRRESLASAGFWMTMLAAAVTPFTALTGWLWMDEMGHSTALTVHQWLGFGIAAAVVALAAWRWTRRRSSSAGAAYLSASVLFVLALAFQGHIGGMMSFGEPEGASAKDVTQQPAAPADGWGRSIHVGDDHGQ